MNIGGVHTLLLRGFEEKVYEELRSLGDEVLSHTATDLLRDKDHVSSSYIGSNSVTEDRMGSIISMLTAYGITVEGARNALHVAPLSGSLGSKKPFPLIITPKRIAETRSKIFQRIYELLAAIHNIEDKEKMFFNWNYRWLVREVNMLEKALFLRLVEENKSVGDELRNIVGEYVGEFEEAVRESVSYRTIRESFKSIIDFLPGAYSDLFERIASMKIFAGTKFNDIIDYTTLVIEKDIFKTLLQYTLGEASRKGIHVFWVTMNPDDDYISRTNHILSWINDTVVLTYIWRNLDQAVLRVDDVVEEKRNENSSIPSHRSIPDIDHASRARELGRELLAGGLWYAKFSRYGPIIQLSYIGEYGDSIVEDGLNELFTVTNEKHGYPRPLMLVRRACRISEEVARGLGDSLLRRVDNPLLKTLLERRSTFIEDIF